MSLVQKNQLSKQEINDLKESKTMDLVEKKRSSRVGVLGIYQSQKVDPPVFMLLRIAIIIVIISLAIGQAQAFNPLKLLFGGGIKAELKTMRNSTDKKMSDIEAKVGVVEGNTTHLEQRIGKIETRISLQGQAVAKAQAGIDQSNQQQAQAGRDVTINDMKAYNKQTMILAGALQSISVLIITGLLGIIKAKNRRSHELAIKQQEYRDLWLNKINPAAFSEKRMYENKSHKDYFPRAKLGA